MGTDEGRPSLSDAATNGEDTMAQKTFPVTYDQVQVCQVKQIHAKCSAHLYGIHLINQLTREQCYEIRAVLKCTVDH